MDWDDVRHFLALARGGSARAAGAALGVSHSTVARRVEALEARLSTRLFDRNRDGYAVTRAGQEMLEAAERIEDEMTVLERGLVGGDERMAGAVSLTMTDPYVARLVLPGLAQLCRDNPGLELSLTTDARNFDLSKREADIALRAVAKDASPPEHLIGRKLVPIYIANYVAVAHAERLDPEGGAARWIGFDDRRTGQGIIDGSSYPDLPVWGSFSSLPLLVQAAREGLGQIFAPTYIGDRDPALRRTARADLRHMGELWLLCHPDLRENARIRATRSAVADTLQTLAPLFRGEWPMDATGRPADAPNDDPPPTVR